jgi:hypothetical protein
VRVQEGIGVKTERGQRIMLAVLLVGLAIATPACRESEETPLGDGAVPTDAANDTDVSVSPEASIEPDGQPPQDDGAADEKIVDGSANDGTNVPGADAGGSAGDAMLDVEIEDATTEPADPTDAGVEDSDAAMPDADAAMPDAPIPDGSEPIVPLFPTCAYMPSIQQTPYAIIDAADAPASSSPCTCNTHRYALTYRVLCGSYTPPAIFGVEICLVPPNRPTGGRQIFIFNAGGACSADDAGPGISLLFLMGQRPLSDWDALLAEQITGHADSGGTD